MTGPPPVQPGSGPAVFPPRPASPILDGNVRRSVALRADAAQSRHLARLDFALLSDPELKAIDAYGVRHAAGGMGGVDIARPALFVLDRKGRIVWKNLTENWRVRVRPDEVLRRLERLP